MSKPLTFCEFNVENLFISLVYYEGEYLESITEEQWTGFALAQLQEKQKSLKKLRALASVFHEINADVFMLVEVGGEESLHHFNLHFLNDEYDCHFVAGNARRGIDLAFLTKKDLPFSAETHSNRDLVVEVSGWTGKQLTKFSRDIAELRLKDREGTLALTVLLTHLKSMLGSETDARGKDVRTAEAFALSELYEKRRKEHPNSPLLVCGDLNSNLSSLELERLRHTDLVNFHEVLGSSPEAQVSYVHFTFDGTAHPNVLDYILISPDLVKSVVPEHSYTYRYSTYYGDEEPLPSSRLERQKLPSDHFPLVLTLDL